MDCFWLLASKFSLLNLSLAPLSLLSNYCLIILLLIISFLWWLTLHLHFFTLSLVIMGGVSFNVGSGVSLKNVFKHNQNCIFILITQSRHIFTFVQEKGFRKPDSNLRVPKQCPLGDLKQKKTGVRPGYSPLDWYDGIIRNVLCGWCDVGFKRTLYGFNSDSIWCPQQKYH